MKVIVITFEDTRLEGVEAVVVIPPGLTAEQTFQKWIENSNTDQDIEDRKTFLRYEQFEAHTL